MEWKDHVVLNPSQVLTDLGANGQQNASETARLLGRREHNSVGSVFILFIYNICVNRNKYAYYIVSV
jgi:hypothetical protein